MQVDDDAVAWPADAVEVARVIDAWGLKGGIRVRPYADDPQALFSSRRWFMRPPDGAGPPRRVPPLLRIRQAKEHSDGVVAIADEVSDRNAAEALKGARIFVSRASFPTPGRDEYYWVDLIGLAVVNREGVELGVVADLISTGPQSVLRVVLDLQRAGQEGSPEQTERLIPFVDAYVDDVDLVARCIRVDWGLDY
ncbi:MAG TPA: ribosome maturation factor RimM [Burkholderiaceae bacterium]|nr:ribosome maturation factor RimM [Burkholderiaceae bacterium]